MFGKYNWRRENRELISKQEKLLAQNYADFAAKVNKPDGVTAEEGEAAWLESNQMVERIETILSHLRQRELLYELDSSPLDVPDEYWVVKEEYLDRILTPKGVKWAKHELKKLRKAEIEFWFKLVMPIVSFITSVIALVRSGHSH